MDHINLFQTNAEFLSAYTNDYVEPWVSFTMENSGMSYNKESGPTPSHDYVEIGGIKWATMNLGATAVTDYGKYYAWGETQGYSASRVGTDKNFSWTDYELCNGTSSNMTKYNSTDKLTTLEFIDDAVVQEWGGNWRMPTREEYGTLLGAVNTQWTNDYQGSGIAGMICTDKTNSSKVLFFPAAGYYLNGTNDYIGESADCYSSTRGGKSYINNGRVVSMNTGGAGVYERRRCQGYPIRGILDE